MKHSMIGRCVLTGLFGFGAHLMAQTAIPIPLFHPTVTTGMVGVSLNQTARLNVLNLNPAPASTGMAATNCTVELQFFDGQGNSVKQTVVPNFAPGKATSLDLKRAEVTDTSAVRTEIRGAVTVNPTPAPMGTPAATGYCSIFATLEVFDDSTGATQVLTSDTRSVFGEIIPLLGRTRND